MRAPGSLCIQYGFGRAVAAAVSGTESAASLHTAYVVLADATGTGSMKPHHLRAEGMPIAVAAVEAVAAVVIAAVQVELRMLAVRAAGLSLVLLRTIADRVQKAAEVLIDLRIDSHYTAPCIEGTSDAAAGARTARE